MTDQEYEALVEERKANKRTIKNAGFKVCRVKRTYRLFNADSVKIAEKPTYYCSFEVMKEFAALTRGAVKV